jgi:hypothetical protein
MRENLAFRPRIEENSGEIIVELWTPDLRQQVGILLPTPRGAALQPIPNERSIKPVLETLEP